MRWILRSVLTWVAVTIVPLSLFAQGNHERTITGKLLFDQSGISCETVKVDLEIAEMQSIETVFADPACNFRFKSVGNGSYLIHVDVDGYEEVHQRLDNLEMGGST